MNKKADASANNTNSNKVGLKLQMLCLSFKIALQVLRIAHKEVTFTKT